MTFENFVREGVYRFHPFPQNISGGGSPEKFSVPTPSVANDLMPREIMSSEPRHWMVFGQLVMLVHCCAEPLLASSLLQLRVLVLKLLANITVCGRVRDGLFEFCAIGASRKVRAEVIDEERHVSLETVG